MRCGQSEPADGSAVTDPLQFRKARGKDWKPVTRREESLICASKLDGPRPRKGIIFRSRNMRGDADESIVVGFCTGLTVTLGLGHGDVARL